MTGSPARAAAVAAPADVLARLAAHRLVPVVVVDDAEQGVLVAGALRDGGLPVAEVTFRTAGARAATPTC